MDMPTDYSVDPSDGTVSSPARPDPSDPFAVPYVSPCTVPAVISYTDGYAKGFADGMVQATNIPFDETALTFSRADLILLGVGFATLAIPTFLGLIFRAGHSCGKSSLR